MATGYFAAFRRKTTVKFFGLGLQESFESALREALKISEKLPRAKLVCVAEFTTLTHQTKDKIVGGKWFKP